LRNLAHLDGYRGSAAGFSKKLTRINNNLINYLNQNAIKVAKIMLFLRN